MRHLLSRYSDTLATQVLTAGFGVVSGILLPRLLGPKGRGELAAVTVWPLTLVFAASLGIDRAAVFFAAKKRQNTSPVASACLGLGTVQSLVAISVGLFVIPVVLRNYGSAVVRLSTLFLFYAPVILANNLQSSMLLGCLDTKSYNLCRTIAPGCYALAIATLFLLERRSILVIVLAQGLGYGVAAWIATRITVRRLRPSWRWEAATVKGMLKYGVKTHAGALTSFINERLDQLLMSLLLPSTQLGIYVAAVAFADSLLIMPRGIGMVTMASGSNCDEVGAWRWARRSALLTALWLVPSGVGLWLLSPWLIPHVFGAAFASSVLPCRILILGSCAMGLTTILHEASRSANHPEVPSFAEVVGLAVTIILLAMLLRPYGPVGAALASAGAYIATMAFTVGYLVFKPNTADFGRRRLSGYQALSESGRPNQQQP
jgi:O-antigen/teichoic acid export membrane protein